MQDESRAGGAAVGVEAHAAISIKPIHLSSTNLYSWAALNNFFSITGRQIIPNTNKTGSEVHLYKGCVKV